MTHQRKVGRTADVLTSADDLAAEIAHAEAMLRTALLAGQPTGATRARIADLRVAAARLASEGAEAEGRRKADEAEAVAQAAESFADQAAGRLAARQPHPISNPKDFQMQHSSAIASAARQVAEAAQGAAAAEIRLAAAAEAETNVRARLDALAAKRAEIIGRRAGGQHNADDGPSLALLAADVEGMAPLLAEAQIAAGAARANSDETRRMLAVARNSLTQAEAEVELGAVVAHLTALDTAVVDGLHRLGELQAALHRSGQPYVPSAAMAHGVRKLLAAAGRL